MRLWTWQKQGFDIADKDTKVKSRENSFYLNYPDPAKCKRFIKAYSKLWEKLGTYKFHWYYTEENEAKNKASYEEYFCNDRVLWKVEVPDGMVFKKICGAAWSYSIGEKQLPGGLYDYWKYKAISMSASPVLVGKWQQACCDFWESKSEDELWDLLILDEYVEPCTQVLVLHPLEKSWIKPNSIKEDKWWEILTRNQYSSTSYTGTLPCLRCPGRTGN